MRDETESMLLLPAVLQSADGTDPPTASSCAGEGVQLKVIVSWAGDADELQNLRGHTAGQLTV